MRFETGNVWERWAWAAWVVLTLVVMVRPVATPQKNTVVPIYAYAAKNWLAGQEMYGLGRALPGMDQFRYAPIFALAFVPVQWLPEGLIEMLWRLVGVVCLLTGFATFVRHFTPELWETSARRAALLGLMIPLSIGSLNNGQANVHLTGLLLFAVPAVAQQRWNLATLCLAVSVFCKLYPIAVVLLVVLMYPRPLGWRMLLALSVGFAIPFLAQSPGYVVGEYESWFAALCGDDRRHFQLGHGYRDLDLLLRWCGIGIPRAEYVLVQLLAGLDLAGYAWLKRRDGPTHLRAVYDLVVCWMILLGPATESCTYILLAPTLACALVERTTGRRLAVLAWLLTTTSVVGIGLGLPKDAMGITQVVGALLLTCDRLRLAFCRGGIANGISLAHGWEAHGR